MKQQLYIIKIGGNVIDDEPQLAAFLKSFAAVDGLKILVHGGGKVATKIGEQLQIESKYADGRRITDEDTLKLVTMVYGGLVNKDLVAHLQAEHCNALGLTGADANVIPAVKRPVKDIDYGYAGDINAEKVNIKQLSLFLDNDIIPVMAPLTHDTKGHMLNTNADTIASTLAVALSKSYNVRLIFCFEKRGVLQDVENDDSVIEVIDSESYEKLLKTKILFGGILPKLHNAFQALSAGVNEIIIGHANQLLNNTRSSGHSGTLIRL